VYEDLEAEDRARYEREAAEADAEAIAEQEARRDLNWGEAGDSSGRGARQKIQEEREKKEAERSLRKQQVWENLDPEERAERERQAELKRQETAERRRVRREQEERMEVQHKKLDKEEQKKAAARLEYLLKQSDIFAKLQGGQHGGSKEPAVKDAPADGDNGEKKRAASGSRSAKREKGGQVHHIHDAESNVSSEEEEDEDAAEEHVFLTKQPSVIKFGQMKQYQVEGLNWMIHLSERGLNGILADEMGLGKTLQSISILAFQWEYKRVQGPHLICVPKSTLSNWMNELKRWCPCLRALKFHGSREEREYMVDNFFTNEAAAHDGRRPDKQIMDENGEMIDDNMDNPRPWDVCVTTYEIANQEKKTLQKFAWKYLVIGAYRCATTFWFSFAIGSQLILTFYSASTNTRYTQTKPIV